MNGTTKIVSRVPEGLSGGEYIYSAEGDRNILYADANVVRLFGCEDYEDFIRLVDNKFCNILHPDDYNEMMRAISAETPESGNQHGYLRYRIITKQGDIRYTESFGHCVQSDDGQVYYYVYIAEITEKEYYNEYYNSFAEGQIDAMSWKIDRLTGLKNIVFCRRELEETALRAKDGICTVAVFDIIGLQKVNYDVGRRKGDTLIRSLVRTVIAHLPKECSVYRGYDAEIIAVCPDKNEQDVIEAIREVILNCHFMVFYGVASTDGIHVTTELSGAVGTIQQALEEALFDLNVKKMLTENSARSQALTPLVRALEEVDQDTEEHVSRTRSMGVSLGKRLKLTETQLTALDLLCLLHDIGKISVPLDILNKPGRLSDAEWAVLRAHPDKGYRIALSSKELMPIADYIRYHHERWDGKGYPANLSAEEIPVLSRIISIVDTYDAMVNDRCYRVALSAEAAMKEIRDNTGTQFDPQIAEEFLQLLADDEELRYGKKTGGSDIRVFKKMSESMTKGDNTQPVIYCEYRLNVDDIIIEAGSSFEEITGYALQDVIGKMSQFDLVPKDDLDDYIIQVGNQFAKGNTAFLRHRIQRKDGSIIHVICHGTRHFDSATRSFTSTIQIYEV